MSVDSSVNFNFNISILFADRLSSCKQKVENNWYDSHRYEQRKLSECFTFSSTKKHKQLLNYLHTN